MISLFGLLFLGKAHRVILVSLYCFTLWRVMKLLMLNILLIKQKLGFRVESYLAMLRGSVYAWASMAVSGMGQLGSSPWSPCAGCRILKEL